MNSRTRPDRRQQILEVLARELEVHPGSRITTAGLARAVGVSEAALYRHFASKAKMFEALIDFAEDSVFTLVNRILEQERDPVVRCNRITQLLLGFAERNPGITRILLGDALVGENERLRARVGRFFERVETQLKQVLREASLAEGQRAALPVDAAAGLIMAFIEGRISRFVRSEFRRSPAENVDGQWAALQAALFR